MKLQKLLKTTLIPLAIASVVGVGCTNKKGWRGVANDGPKSAYEIYAQLQESATSFNAEAVLVDGETQDGLRGGVTWGAEKEASSGLITRVMSPTSDSLKAKIDGLADDKQEEFLRDFFKNYQKNANGYRTFKTEEGRVIDYAVDVKDVEGNPKTIDMDRLRFDVDSADLATLKEKWYAFLDMTDGRPMSFLKPSVRMKFFKGTLPGLNGNGIKGGYGSWVPNWGLAQKYISDAHGHYGGQGGGWEINFKPQHTYGEFEESVAWFRTELKNAGQLFQAPGHQRMVFKTHPNLDEAKLSELYKAIQAIIVVDGIKGRTGIEKANYKSVLPDSSINSLSSGRGVIRLEGERWGAGTRAVEFRAGTKDLRVARFVQTVLAARVATNDFTGLVDSNTWELFPGVGYSSDGFMSKSDLAARFDVPEETAEKALAAFHAGGVKKEYTVPFWNWTHEANPILNARKRTMVKSLTKDLIIQAAEIDSNHEQGVRNLMRSWIKSTNLSQELRAYIKPKGARELADDILHFSPPSGRQLVQNLTDVNNIDLGIEYSGKLPLKLDADYSPDKLADNKKAWLSTGIDLTPEEREQVIKNVANDLLAELGGSGEATKVEGAGGHGHGLELAYELRDSQNRKWIVEWDGVGRSYTPSGDIIEGSPRAGSLELVTPKFVPSTEEMDAVYKAFEKNNILPNLLTGGGHINVDLAAFDGKPKQLARFMSLFHEHRGIISLMFQHVNRLKSSEPIDISDNLTRQLKDFNGSEEDLKKLLYDEQYFNTRFGRKTRYNQLDMSAYFQDVIPEEFITEDFDIQDPTDPWRRQFRVDPNIRKAEFRLFNAPRDTYESALQIRLVRALLHKALNEDDALDGTVQNSKHLDYLNDPERAMSDLQKLCDDLGLNIDEYRPAVAEGLSETDLASRSVFFETLEEKLRLHPKQPAWGSAVEARTADNAISSEGRQWTPGPADQQNTLTNEHRIRAAERGEELRNSITPLRELPGNFKRTDSCLDAMAAIL